MRNMRAIDGRTDIRLAEASALGRPRRHVVAGAWLAAPLAVLVLGLAGCSSHTGDDASGSAQVEASAVGLVAPETSDPATSEPSLGDTPLGLDVAADPPPVAPTSAIPPTTKAAQAAPAQTAPTRAAAAAVAAPHTSQAPPPPPAQAAPPPQNQAPAPAPPATTAPPPANCDPAYPDNCLHDGIGDYDCAGGSGNGPNYVSGPIRVLPPDPFGLDGDGDGIGCQSS
ncbi:hypothetical protein FraEuI1c_6707 [Pseudofrankia inefficax]|uniref:Excalibur domain protein n=2 Tax=Pseudofrankia inefficax (strain DSM 45817 / CECT 9037 / DDB 130130 / EuI1c) TaxID=298654 RepID=E3JB56_PSEI1|nr:hypothetical protein FraEuI1c_6707 [Pseudofrankia inefficax]